MSTNASTTFNLQYTPPSAPAGSGTAVFVLPVTFNAQCVGQIDLQPIITPPDVISIPFGGVAKAKLLIIKNLMSNDIGVRLNGSVTDSFDLCTMGEFIYISPTNPLASPITAAVVVALIAPLATVESIQYWVFGD
jgi:hypothetical protein